MIIDVHSHAWEYPAHFSDDFRQQAKRAKAGVEMDLTVTHDAYRATAPDDTITVVFGGKARLSGLWVDDRYVANYVAADPARLIGFLSVDPTQPGWEEELQFGHQELGLRGIKLLSMYAGFRPDESRLDPLWRYATKHRLPVLLRGRRSSLKRRWNARSLGISMSLPRGSRKCGSSWRTSATRMKGRRS
jgi:predicted TIM-barrel fold metal-dependent hydrolase